jgi:hypothetical protein
MTDSVAEFEAPLWQSLNYLANGACWHKLCL